MGVMVTATVRVKAIVGICGVVGGFENDGYSWQRCG